MSIFYTNKTITMNRGDSGIVLLSILNRDDTPFALPIGMQNPTIVFSVKAETDVNDLNGNMLIEEYLPIKDYTYYGYGTPDESGQMKIHGGFYPKVKTVDLKTSVIDPGIIYKVLKEKKYMFVVPTPVSEEHPTGLKAREYAFAVPIVFEPAFTDRLSPGTYTYSITLLDSTSPVQLTQGEGDNATTADNYSEFLANVTLKQDLFGSQKLILGDSPIARVHGDPIRRIYNIKPCSEESVANATASEITTGNITNIALPPVYIATKDQLGGVIVGETLRVDFRGVLNVSEEITNKIADLYNKIGDMKTLTTDEKTTLVGAINEVDEHADANKINIGNLSALTTDEKNTLVGAINEVDAHANTGISKADAAQATADNATILANTGISKAEQAQQTADNAQQDAETAQATADNATTLANTGISKADRAQTTANTAVDKANDAKATANEAIMKADGRATSIGFMTAKDAVTALNGYPRTQLKGGDTIWIVEDGTPDLWVTDVAQESVPYNYTTKDKFNQDLVDNKVLQIGYFKTAYQESDGKPVTIAWQNVVVKSTDWVASTEFADFPYEAKIELTDFVDYTTVPQVVFDIADTMSGNYAPICKSGDKCVYIYGKVQDEITLKTVITFAPNVNGASVVGGGYNNRGKWVASTTYAIDDLVYTDNGQYVCIEGITSTTSPEQDTTHWQATFVATGKTKNTLTISGQDNGTEVQKTFDGSTAVEVAFDENTMTTKEVNGVLKVGAKGTIPEALPQETSTIKSGSLPTSGWTMTGVRAFWQGSVDCPSGDYVFIGTSKALADILYADDSAYMIVDYNYFYGGYYNKENAEFSYKKSNAKVNGLTGISFRAGYNDFEPTIFISRDGKMYGKGMWQSTGHYDVTYTRIGASTVSQQIYTISDTSITTNGDILMELTDEGRVKAYSMEAGKITVIRDTVPTAAIPYTYKVKQTNTSGQFTLVNHFVPTRTSQLENDSDFITKADIPFIPTRTSELENDSGYVSNLPTVQNVVCNDVDSAATLDTTITCEVGDLILAQIIVRSALTLPTDWTLLRTIPAVETSSNQTLSFAYKRATSTSETLTVTQATAGRIYTNLVRLSNAVSVSYIQSCEKTGTGIKSISSTKPVTSNMVIWGASSVTWNTSSPYGNWSSSPSTLDYYSLSQSTKAPRLGTFIDRSGTGTRTFKIPLDSSNSMMCGAVEIVGDEVARKGDIPTKTSELTNDSGFAKTTEANTWTGVQTFSNADGIKTDRVHNLENNDAWYNFDGSNNRFGSPSRPTIIRTSEARPKAQVPSGETTVTKEIALLEDIANALYPVGSIYMSVNNTNPSTFFGGTWEAWGAGKVPVGVDTNDTNFATVEKTGGEKQHTLTIAEMPEHNHTIPCTPTANDGSEPTYQAAQVNAEATGNHNSIVAVSSGGGSPHNNLQPYITCYMWKRTA